MRCNRIPKTILERNTGGRREKRKPKEQGIDGVRRSRIKKDLKEEGSDDREM